MPPRIKRSSLGGLTDEQMDHMASDIPDYGGCYAKDQITRLPIGKVYVVNMQDHTGGGTHWVLLDTRSPQHFFYFDSYGVPPPRPLVTFAKKHHAQMSYNPEDIQTYTSEACGWFCLYMMFQMEHRTMVDIIHHDFVDLNTHQPLSNPDNILRRYFS
jgi:hypothetical protein